MTSPLVLFDLVSLAATAAKSRGIVNYVIGVLPSLQSQLEERGGSLVISADLATIELLNKSLPSNSLCFHVWSGTRISWLAYGAYSFCRGRGVSNYLSPSGFLAVLPRRTRSSVVIHDLIPLWYRRNFPRHFGRIHVNLVSALLWHSYRFADSVVAISSATLIDLRASFGRRELVQVVHNGVPDLRKTCDSLIPRDIIFAVSSDLPHKNLEGLLSAYSIYREAVAQPLPLYVCGVKADQQGPVEGVVFLHGIDSEALAKLYARCLLFVSLSWIEGFGFPILEARSCGANVLCSDIAAYREVAEGHVEFVSPDNPVQVAGRMRQLLEVGPHELASGVNVATCKFSWQACASGLIDSLHLSHD